SCGSGPEGVMSYAPRFVCLLLVASAAWGQQSSARLLGTVKDPTGAVIAAASISVTSSATGQERKTVTDSLGEYSIAPLPVGDYTVRVEAAGFKTSTIHGLALRLDHQARVDLSMALGSTSETIQGEGSAPLLVTDSSSVGQVIENKAIVAMPLNGRAFWQLAQLTPGVVFTPGGSDITSGGQGIRATRIGLR